MNSHHAHYCFDFDETITKIHYHKYLSNPDLALARSESELKARNLYLSDKIYSKADQNNDVTEDPSRIATIRNLTIALLKNPNTSVKNADELAATFNSIIKNGDKISIVSYSYYPEAIHETLKFITGKMGLTGDPDKLVEKYFMIVSYIPEAQAVGTSGKEFQDIGDIKHAVGKSGHIKIAADAWIKKESAEEKPQFSRFDRTILIDDDMVHRSNARNKKNNYIAIDVSASPDAPPVYLTGKGGVMEYVKDPLKQPVSAADKFRKPVRVSEKIFQDLPAPPEITTIANNTDGNSPKNKK